MKPIPIRNCAFVTFGDLTKGLNQNFIEAFCEQIGRNLTWGDANRTMVDVDHFNDFCESSDYPNSARALRRRLQTLMISIDYVDMEN